MNRNLRIWPLIIRKFAGRADGTSHDPAPRRAAGASGPVSGPVSGPATGRATALVIALVLSAAVLLTGCHGSPHPPAPIAPAAPTTAPHAAGTAPHAAGTAPHAAGTAPHATGTPPHAPGPHDPAPHGPTRHGPAAAPGNGNAAVAGAATSGAATSAPAPSSAPAAADAPEPAAITAVVTRVVDGDTLMVREHGELFRVRLAGIDAPEYTQPGGVESRDALQRLVAGGAVQLEARTTDRYGRQVAVLRAGGAHGDDVGLSMIRLGRAWFYRRYARDIAPAQREQYALAERQARQGGVGLWADPAARAPWTWRHGATPAAPQAQ